MPKCGGSPASVVEKAMAWGSVTTASVSPTSRLPRSAGSMRGSTPARAFSGRRSARSKRRLLTAERFGVADEGRHDGHHRALPQGHQRALLVAGRPRQRGEVIGDVAALLVVEAALLAQRHVAADEAGHDGVHPREIHARVEAEGIGAGERRVEHAPLHDRSEGLRAVTPRAFLGVDMGAADVVVAAAQRRGDWNLVHALLRVAIADLQFERGAQETAVSGDVAYEIVGRVRLEAVRRIDIALHLAQLVGQQEAGETVVHVGHYPRGGETVRADQPVARGVLLVPGVL